MLAGVTLTPMLTSSPGWRIPVEVLAKVTSQLIGLVETPVESMKVVGALPVFSTFTWMVPWTPGISVVEAVGMVTSTP